MAAQILGHHNPMNRTCDDPKTNCAHRESHPNTKGQLLTLPTRTEHHLLLFFFSHHTKAKMAEEISPKIAFSWSNFLTCLLVSIGCVAFGYPSAMTAPMLAKASFLEFTGLGDANGIHKDKSALSGSIGGIFQVRASVPRKFSETDH